MSRHKTRPRGHLSSVVEVTRVADGGNDRACSDRTDAGHSRQTMRGLTLFGVNADPHFAAIYLLVQVFEMLIGLVEESAHGCRNGFVLA